MTLVKEFENRQLDWWCNHYRTTLNDLAVRVRQYLDGDIERGLLEPFLNEVEKNIVGREKLA